MSKIASFTQYFVLHPYALDILSPPDFQKFSQFDQKKTSLLEILESCKQNPFSNPQNTSYMYRAYKWCLLAPLKVAYMGGVMLIFSRLGCVVNGGLTAYSYAKYKWEKYKDISWQEQHNAWEKTESYARAFGIDLSSTLVGGFLTYILADRAYPFSLLVKEGWKLGKWDFSGLALGGALTCFSAAMLASVQSPQVAPVLFARSDERAGMLLSLSLRKYLGLVGSNGDSLPFSGADTFEYKRSQGGSIQFEGKNYEKLTEIVKAGEIELIDIVQKINGSLSADKKIQYCYPLNGDTIADRLEKDQAKIRADLLAKLRLAQHKITILRKIYFDVLEIACNPDLFKQIQRAVVSDTPRLLKVQSSVLTSESYQYLFNSSSSSTQEASKLLDQEDIQVVSPETSLPSEDQLFARFRHKAGVNKWCIANNTPNHSYPAWKMIDLQEDATYIQYKKARSTYRVAMHPDKHSNTQESTALFNYLQDVVQKLEPKYGNAANG